MTTTTKSETTEKNKPQSAVAPSDDELLARDLPRPGAASDTSKTKSNAGTRDLEITSEIGSIRSEAPTDPKRIRPVELESKKPATPAKTTSEHGVATDPKRPISGIKSGAVPSAGAASMAVPIVGPGMDKPAIHPDDTRPALPTARMTGQSLRFPVGVALIPGRTVDVNGVAFEIKPEEAFKGMFWAKSFGIMVVTLLAAIGVAYLLSGPDPGSLTGVVINSQTGEIVPGATIALGDERTATTNEAGLYSFNDVKPEQYVLAASCPGFDSQNGFIEVEGGDNEQLSFALAPLVAMQNIMRSDSAYDAAKTQGDDEPGNQQQASSSSGPTYGSVDLNCDFSGYMVFVDGELYGKNSEQLKRLTAGDHRVLLQLEGYEDFVTTVSVRARNTATIKVAKTDLKPRIDPIKRSRGHFAQGKTAIDQQAWSQAIRDFDEALTYDPEYAEALQYRGWVYMKLGNLSLAMADLTRAADLFDNSRRYIDAVACAKYMIEISPKDPLHWRRRGDYNLALTDYKQAIEDYEQAVKLDKKSLDSHLALAEALYAAGEYKDAAKEFDRARKLAEDPSHAYIRMILSYYNAGDRDDVVKKYEDFAEIASPELMQRLRNDPEWLKILQMIGPEERLKN